MRYSCQAMYPMDKCFTYEYHLALIEMEKKAEELLHCTGGHVLNFFFFDLKWYSCANIFVYAIASELAKMLALFLHPKTQTKAYL